MNKEYMYLDSGEIIVTDEKGIITKRKVVGNDKEILEAENKLEVINTAINNFNKSLSKERKNAKQSKAFKNYRYIITIISFIIYLATLPSGGLNILLGYSIFSLIFGKIFKHIEKTSKKEISDLTNKLEECFTIKENYEKELQNEKLKTHDQMAINYLSNEIFKLEDINIESILSNNDKIKILQKIKK